MQKSEKTCHKHQDIEAQSLPWFEKTMEVAIEMGTSEILLDKLIFIKLPIFQIFVTLSFPVKSNRYFCIYAVINDNLQWIITEITHIVSFRLVSLQLCLFVSKLILKEFVVCDGMVRALLSMVTLSQYKAYSQKN